LGGRAIPAKTKRSAVAASFDAPQSAVEPLRFFDEEAEKVRHKFLEELKED
jgi:hypothetical protein